MKALFLAFSLGAALAGGGEPKYLSVTPLDTVKIHPGETVMLPVKFRVDSGMHVQANPASRKNLIPTTLTFEKTPGIEIGAPAYPAGKPFRLKGSDADIATYDGDVEIRVPLTADAKAKAGKRKLSAKLRYQACEEASCFFPMTVAVEAPLVVLSQK